MDYSMGNSLLTLLEICLLYYYLFLFFFLQNYNLFL